MPFVLGKAKVYLKTGAAVLLLAFALVFILANRGNTANVWFCRQFSGVSAVWLVLFSAIGGIILWWLLKWFSALLGQWRSLRQGGQKG